MIVLEMGGSSRLCAALKPGEPVVVMGPTGTPTEIPQNETVLLAGGGLGNAVLFSIARRCKAHGCKVIYFAGYKNGERPLQAATRSRPAPTRSIWCDRRRRRRSRRAGRRTAHFRGNIVQAMVAYAEGRARRADGARFSDVDAHHRHRLRPHDARGARRRATACSQPLPQARARRASARINSPMQCMMKEVCAQCLQQHVDPETGKESFVFSCFNQDQQLDHVDFANLNARLRENTVQEKLSNL